MRRFVWILVGSMLLAPPGLALKPNPEEPAADARRSELSDELGAFVRQAVNEGLLDPVGTKAAEDRKAAQELPVVTEPAAAQAAPPPEAGPIDCSKPYPLDFEAFGALASYHDIYAYREDSPVAGETGDGSNPGLTLARAYLSLDLASEAAMTVKSGRDQDAVALRHLADLLDGRSTASVEYFSELTACYPEAGLWLGLALISRRDGSAAPLIEANLTGFRKLPLQLRDRAAMIAIPELDGLGERTLAQLLFASFTEEEVANSTQLRFSKAVLELASGDPEAEQLIGQFLIQARFQEPALSALVRYKRPVNAAVREILIDDMVNRIELAQQDADVRNDLRFVLDEMSNASMYVPMLKLAELPSMQSPEARAELTNHLAASLKRDLASDESLHNLAAIEALIKDPGLLDAAPERAALYETATVVAVRLGFGSLGDALANKAEGGEGVAEQRAVLAYRQKQVDEVFTLAARYPANQKITLIAARAAIDAQDKAKLSVYESRLTLAPETVLALIEQDAEAARWIVSEKIFQAAAKLTDKDQKSRVDRVLRLKQASPPAAAPGRVNMSSIPGKLDRSRQSLEQMTGGAP
ncbi:hypothetical protein [Hyphomonas sp.]|uniref:hypothetical protein n=1 Tax=Hyphomonas sp. TaxID=87 RepID=UPI0025C2704A|nr:hypothetical protein [Hyphomonas sp.]